MKIRLFFQSILILFLITCKGPTSPSDPVVYEYFSVGQQRVIDSGWVPEWKALSVTVEDFKWISREERYFMCGDVLSEGCFSTRPPRIEYPAMIPRAIIHESGHAILWKLKHPDWKKWEH